VFFFKLIYNMYLLHTNMYNFWDLFSFIITENIKMVLKGLTTFSKFELEAHLVIHALFWFK
jgi:hypothetical protein